jgi:hypothetical protein
MTQATAVLFALALACTLWMDPGRRRNVMLLASLFGLILALVVDSTPRLVGDARQYVIMSVNFARFDAPSATSDDLSRLGAMFPGETGEGFAMSHLRGPD